jgi:hypothetical protein
MPTKVRKQIYLDQRQNRQLKRLAEARGVSEAQVIRNLLDDQTAANQTGPLPPDREAWEAFVRFARQRALSGVTGEPYKWNRDEIYEEREGRYGPIVDGTEDSVAPAPRPPDADAAKE